MRRPRRRVYEEARYTSEVDVAVAVPDPADAPLVAVGDPRARPRGPDAHRFHDGRLWRPLRFGAQGEHVVVDDMLAELSGARVAHRPVEEDPDVRDVGWTDRARSERETREAAGRRIVVDGVCWMPADEPVLAVDASFDPPEVVVSHVADGDLGNCHFRLDQVDWILRLHPDVTRVPDVRVPRPDLLTRRTTERAVLRSAKRLLDTMAGMLADAEPDFFLAYHRLRTLAVPFETSLAVGGPVDWEPLAAAMADACPFLPPLHGDCERVDVTACRETLARLDVAREALDDMPGFAP